MKPDESQHSYRKTITRGYTGKKNMLINSHIWVQIDKEWIANGKPTFSEAEFSQILKLPQMHAKEPSKSNHSCSSQIQYRLMKEMRK